MRLGQSFGEKLRFPLPLCARLSVPLVSYIFTDFASRKRSILMKNNKKRPLEKYLAPTAEVVQVDVERGFAVSAPGYGDGGIW